MTLVLLLGAAGGLGAALRFVVDGLIRTHVAARFPVGTFAINLSGSLLLGVVLGLTVGGLLPGRWHLILGVGFLGGYTTFSTASVETVRLLQDRRIGLALVNGVGMLLASVGAAAVGLWLGQILA